MAETQTLNFGPEWLRALSGGGVSSSVASPPLSPALPKYKLADYRYGREEMLALYVKDNMVPVDLHDKEFLPILQEEPLLPLALVPFTEEEQRNFSMSVNSTAVLRLTGRGGGTVTGAPRGRSSSRGRGRGRGDGGFYQRSFDEVEGGFGRGGREMHRSQSWEERGDRRFEKPGRKDPDGAPAHFPVNHIRANYEDVAGNTRKQEFTRENWRMSRDEQNGEDDDAGWRIAGSRRENERWCPPSPDGPRSAGWREHPDQRRRFPFDSRDEERSGYRRAQSGNGSVEEERDSLPEWCLEDAEEETGTFDSSGAFLSLKKAPKEPILEEAELDFRPLEESEEYAERDESESEQTKDADMDTRQEGERSDGCSKSGEPSPAAVVLPTAVTPPEPATPAPLPTVHPEPAENTDRPLERPTVLESCKAPPHTALPNSIVEAISIPHITTKLPDLPVPSSVLPAQPMSTQTQHVKPVKVPVAGAPLLPLSTGVVGPISRPNALPSDMDEDEGLKHFEQEAEKMVAYLQDGVVDDERLAAKLVTKPTALHTTHEAAFKWFYKDPQGEIQGPFKNQEMSEWFQAGYFTMTLQVKRGCDEMFQPLGDIMKLWGRVPFTPGPTLPPMVGDAEQERMKRQQELNALNMFQMQQLQFQYLLRQQYAQALAQQKVLSSAPPPPTQQQQQLNLLLHQALKIRTPEPQQSLLPPVTRSMSVPDSGSVWEMQNPSTQASCSPNMPPAAPSTWEGSSVWDLPLDSMAPVSSIEQQIQQMEKAKAVKLEMERREAELRAKREEEERKRLEEARRARQDEERKRLDEEELARRKQEEALQRQYEQEEAERRHKEEEERLAQEETLRKLEERRREEEERRKREELLRKQQEGERRKREELEALRRREEEKQQQQEEEAAAAAALARQQQEEQKRREQETQKQQELQRQRQQQQEALRRLQQQQQLAQMKLPSSSKWGQQSTTASTISQSQNALSLAEIQKLEEERERQAQEEQRRLEQELHRNQPQQQQPQTKLSGWGNVAKQPPATKSLLEIQREEAQQMKQGKEQQQQQQQTPQPPQQQQPLSVTQQIRTQNRATLSSSVWGSVNNIGSNWAMDSSSVWGDAQNSNVGFWDEAVKETPPPQATRKSHTQKNKGNANLSNSSSGKVSKKVEEEEKLMKLFQGANNNQDGFMQWCEQTLHTLNAANNLDVPTFASFLKEVDSPYEVHDYVRAYLGDTPQAKDFAKQFLERRAKQNTNQQKPQPGQQQKQQESMWGVSQVSQQVLHQQQQQQQQQRFETVTSGKKKKKQKMVRADPSLLGFSVNASSERLNMGEIETVEDI
ncbi:GRB10-interacting GYF protein 2 isoform X4 [Triplophysa dalaica]|uniref:GRB10-interacting GYF protein 2 isoform X4 n=1 Tax=Triplophysa dalaica TaxID=1582913 RepID=UPI0024DF72EE|nr:GRB10-interacting GYF protein 2 isoform X4 [Triplophysa dalaica]